MRNETEDKSVYDIFQGNWLFSWQNILVQSMETVHIFILEWNYMD